MPISSIMLSVTNPLSVRGKAARPKPSPTSKGVCYNQYQQTPNSNQFEDKNGKKLWEEAKLRSDKLTEVVKSGLKPIEEEIKETAKSDFELLKTWFIPNSTTTSTTTTSGEPRRAWRASVEVVSDDSSTNEGERA